MAATRLPHHLQSFVKLRPQVEGVLQRAGRRTWDLVLIDVAGTWERDEFASAEAARSVGERLGVRVHEGWSDPRIGRRLAGRDQWAAADGQRRGL
jgi:hypothetical protein